MPVRVTFITPHRRRTSGGVYAIERFATGLARTMEVSLVVEKGPPGELPGVATHRARALEADELPDADVLIVPADARAGERLFALPASKGRPVLLFQGYGTPGSPVVSANLDRADIAIVVSRWLIDEAARHDCRAVHVPYGFDRDVFFPGQPAERRAPLVTMLVHSVAWKGTEDGLAALAEVRRAMPETQVRLFGPSQPDSPFRSIGALERGEVGEMLRRSAVYVCPSWEEGFGMPGLEAMACGAALATTDTKGSRDYAVNGSTALVSEPRDRAALAANVLELLRDRRLRGSLATAGREYARTNFVGWPGAAKRFAAALEECAALPREIASA
jgi:glycosyltransferase involved in cell wall biosynthesis